MSGTDRLLEIAVHRPRLRVDRKALRKAIALLDGQALRFMGGCPKGELSIAFVTDPALAQLHDHFLDDASPTDVITFEGNPAHGLAGEVCVSVDAAVRQVGSSEKKLSREITLYVVHGWLHLAGYDDLRPAAKRAMRRAEARAMRILEGKAAVPRFKLA